MAISKNELYKLAYGNNAKELGFQGRVSDEKRLFDRFFSSYDKGDHQTAANIYRTLEENNWHTMSETLVNLMNKPANQRGSYFDHAETWNKGEERKAELKQYAKRQGVSLPSTPSRSSRNTSITLQARAKRAGSNVGYQAVPGTMKMKKIALGSANGSGPRRISPKGNTVG